MSGEERDRAVAPQLAYGVRRVATLGPHAQPVGRIAWSPRGDLIVAPTETGPIVVWDAATHKPVGELIGHEYAVVAVAFDASGRMLVSVGGGGDVIIWDVHSGAIQHDMRVPTRNEDHWEPVGPLLATGEEPWARLWRSAAHGLDVPSVGRATGDAGHIMCIAVDASGTLLATGDRGGSIRLTDVHTGHRLRSLEHSASMVLSVAFHPDGALVSASDDRSIKVWEPQSGRHIRTLEGHTRGVRSLAFVAKGRLLASGAKDGSVRLWESSSGKPLATVEGRPSRRWKSGLAAHPWLPRLARVVDGGHLDDDCIDILELDVDTLLQQSRSDSVTYTSAKIVLLGDAGVGKTGLGWRLAHSRFREHASTHGQQFWVVDRLSTFRADGTRCEAVLWDLAGQPDYRLIHALFIEDADLALVLFDPCREDDPVHGVDYWLRQLRYNGQAAIAHGQGPRVLLVAARADRGSPRMTAQEIEDFTEQRGLRGAFTTSALTGEGVEELLAAMREETSWDERPTTVTTATFKVIKDYVLVLKEQALVEHVIPTPAELRERIERLDPRRRFSEEEVKGAVGHLANHGFVTRLLTSDGSPRVLLAPELLNNVASSIVLAARRNPSGLGSLEERVVLSSAHGLPELAALPESDRGVLLDSAVALFLERKLCFRQTDPLSLCVYLVFPELINLKKPAEKNGPQLVDDVAYVVTGAVENLYASLVVLLGYANTFTRTNQWRNHARYLVGDADICGFRSEAIHEGEVEFVLYFGTTVRPQIRSLFRSLFESFLMRPKVAVRRFGPLICPKGHPLNRTAVREQVSEGDRTELFCMRCGAPVRLPTDDDRRALSAEESAELAHERGRVADRSRVEQMLYRLSTYVADQAIIAPTCFMSYAWGVAEHVRWVETLAEDLAKAGINVIFDRWENTRPGRSISRYVEQIEKSDRVIVVGTPLYRERQDTGESSGGSVLSAEVALINTRLLGSEREKETILPVLLAGTPEDSFIPLLHDRMHVDVRSADQYFERLLELVASLYDIPARDPVRARLRRAPDVEAQ